MHNQLDAQTDLFLIFLAIATLVGVGLAVYLARIGRSDPLGSNRGLFRRDSISGGNTRPVPVRSFVPQPYRDR